jgi:hypothetical protein
MRTHSKSKSDRSAITRHFEPSRHQRTDLAIAFERALPIIRRTSGRPLVPPAAVGRSGSFRRAGS